MKSPRPVQVAGAVPGAAGVVRAQAPMHRPGLLARLGQIFIEFDLSLQNAKIATLGERVEDVFFITNAQHQPLTDPALCAQLQQAIVTQLEQANGAPAGHTFNI